MDDINSTSNNIQEVSKINETCPVCKEPFRMLPTFIFILSMVIFIIALTSYYSDMNKWVKITAKIKKIDIVKNLKKIIMQMLLWFYN